MKIPSLVLVLFVTAGLALPQRTSKTKGRIALPLKNANATDIIEGSFIAVYNKNVTSADVRSHQAAMISSLSKRDSESISNFEIGTWKAFAIKSDDATMMSIANSEEVAYIEADTKVFATSLVEQSGSQTGLNRLSHEDIGATTYVFDTTMGAGVTVFVIDTGVLPTHSEFGGRATLGANLVAGSINTDENGHGTHVAGTIGGTTFGVAKAATIVGVKVLDASGSGSNSLVLAGINWVTQNVTASGLAGKAVINMSLGGGKSAAINAAAEAAIKAGITVVAAAGNENVDAANSSPASAANVITVGAIDAKTDIRASFSNFGSLVDIFAPGVSVLSSSIASNTATKVLSGTSMACPHVAGLAAYLIALENLATPADVTARIKALAVQGGGVVAKAGTGTSAGIAYNGSGL